MIGEVAEIFDHNLFDNVDVIDNHYWMTPLEGPSKKFCLNFNDNETND